MHCYCNSLSSNNIFACDFICESQIRSSAFGLKWTQPSRVQFKFADNVAVIRTRNKSNVWWEYEKVFYSLKMLLRFWTPSNQSQPNRGYVASSLISSVWSSFNDLRDSVFPLICRVFIFYLHVNRLFLVWIFSAGFTYLFILVNPPTTFKARFCSWCLWGYHLD